MACTYRLRHLAVHHVQEKSDFVDNTNFGFEALSSYRNDLKEEYIERALEYFQCALGQYDLDSDCRAIALFNLATSKFIRCLTYGTYSGLYEPINLYREALESRDCGHPDRPATLLLLTQALSAHLGLEYHESTATQIAHLLAEIHPDGSRERQTADAIIRTCRLYRVVHSGDPTEVDELVKDLDRGAYVPPYGYFDKPHVLHKLGVALWARFHLYTNLGDLDKSTALNQEASCLIPDGHHDQQSIAACLDMCSLGCSEALEDLTDVGGSANIAELGKKVITTLDNISYGPPLEELQEQITLLSNAETAFKHVARVVSLTGIPEIRTLVDEWSNRDSIPTKCKRELWALLRYLGGEGGTKIGKLLAKMNCPFKTYKTRKTVQVLQNYIPYFQDAFATKLGTVLATMLLLIRGSADDALTATAKVWSS